MIFRSLRALTSSALVIGILLSTSASAVPFTDTVLVDPWPDDTVSNSDLLDLSISFTVPMSAIGDATVALEVIGDFNGTTEFIDVVAETFSMGRIFNGIDGDDVFNLSGDDPGNSILFAPAISLSGLIPLATLNVLIADGTLGFSFQPTGAQQPSQGVPAEIRVTVSFETADVPEPATLAILVLGLAGIGASRRIRA